jgi:RNA 2',3'-cyclic 3'-phosphodiesterase
VSEELVRLAQQVESAAVEAGFAPEGRSYAPHLTIGRVRDLSGWHPIRQALAQSSSHEFGSTLISEMILYRSVLGREASQYQPLSRYTFTAPSV